MDQRRRIPLALTLILVGTLMLLSKLNILRFEFTWPIILIAVGILFLVKYLTRPTDYQLLLPTTILLILGTLFLYLDNTNYQRLNHLWPTFIIAPGIGFLFMFLLGPAKNRYWQPALILISVAGLFYWGFWHLYHYWPVLLILIGLIFLIDALLHPKSAK